jgi:arsenate reductase
MRLVMVGGSDAGISAAPGVDQAHQNLTHQSGLREHKRKDRNTRGDPPPAKRRRNVSKPSVLFVCVHNAGRSQMAAGWLEHLGGGQVEVRSAGSAPGNKINPAAIEVMREADIDITTGHPKILTTDDVRASDVVITMGCGDTCPIFPGKRYEDWDLPDPAGQPTEMVRQVRDEIEKRVRALLTELLSDSGPAR